MKYRIYGFEECPYCQKAKALLTECGADFDYVAIGTLEERTAWMDERGFQKPKRTFPKVYILDGAVEDELIGGYDDLDFHMAFQ